MKQWIVTLFNRASGKVLITSSELLTEQSVRNYFLGAVKTIVPFTPKAKYDNVVEISSMLAKNLGDNK